jgi:hypothetical protein
MRMSSLLRRMILTILSSSLAIGSYHVSAFQPVTGAAIPQCEVSHEMRGIGRKVPQSPLATFSSPSSSMVTSSSSKSRSRSISSSSSLKGFLVDLFSPKKESTGLSKEPEKTFDPVVIDPDYRVAILFLAIGFLLDLIPYLQLSLGPIITALGVLFWIQTGRIRFVFDETAFELKTTTGNNNNNNNDPNQLNSSGENVVVGGANRWETKSIINYDFYPENWIDSTIPGFPILVYFKETQTPAETWNNGPGKLANDPEKIASGLAKAGQVHFFPAVCNAQQIRDEFAKRGCKKI